MTDKFFKVKVGTGFSVAFGWVTGADQLAYDQAILALCNLGGISLANDSLVNLVTQLDALNKIILEHLEYFQYKHPRSTSSYGGFANSQFLADYKLYLMDSDAERIKALAREHGLAINQVQNYLDEYNRRIETYKYYLEDL